MKFSVIALSAFAIASLVPDAAVQVADEIRMAGSKRDEVANNVHDIEEAFDAQTRNIDDADDETSQEAFAQIGKRAEGFLAKKAEFQGKISKGPTVMRVA
ncbi:hypothetical protein DICA3_C18756 [Diutina catenulata]